MQRFDGQELRRRRETSGQRREAVAVELGRSAETVALYEKNKVDPPASTVAKLADLLGCDAGDLFTSIQAEADAAPPLSDSAAAALAASGLR